LASNPQARGAKFQIAKDVSVLWIDYVTPQDVLPGMRQVAQTSLKILNPNGLYLELNQPGWQLPLPQLIELPIE
jgi:hypothetical protein